MNIQEQTNPELQELAKKLKSQRTVLLTLPDELGSLSCRPMTAQEMDAQAAVWMMVSRKAPWVAQAHGKPANLGFAMPDDGDYVSFAGHASLVDDAERKKELWSVVARPWWSGPDDPDLMLLKVTPTRIELWDGPDNAVSRILSLAASVIAGREVGLGEKQVITP